MDFLPWTTFTLYGGDRRRFFAQLPGKRIECPRIETQWASASRSGARRLAIRRIWIAVSVYVLVAIVKKRLDLDASLYTLLQILSVTLFGPIHDAGEPGH